MGTGAGVHLGYLFGDPRADFARVAFNDAEVPAHDFLP